MVYYTFGGEPTRDSTAYSSPIVLNQNGTFTINALGVEDGYGDSAVASATYTLDLGAVAEPTFHDGAGTQLGTGRYWRDLAVEIRSATVGADIYYTVAAGNTAPTPEPGAAGTEVYDGTPIAIGGDGTETTLRAVATSPGRADSVVAKETFTIDWPELTLVADPSTGGSVEINGQGSAGPAPLVLDSAVGVTATAGTGYQFGSWSVQAGDSAEIDITDPLSASTTITLGPTDATILASFVDEGAPDAPTISLQGAGDGDVTNQDVQFTLGGLEAGADVEYSLDGGTAWIGYTPGDTIILSQELEYRITARQTDLENNTSAESPVITVTIDKTEPVKPAAPSLDPADDSGASDSDGITNIDSGLTFSGTTEPGVTITLTSSRDGALGTVVADGSGQWSLDVSLTPDEATPHEIVVTAADAAGNTASSDATSITVDTTPPTTPSSPTLDPADDTGSSNSDGVTNQTSGLTFSGTAGASAFVTLSSNVDGTLGSVSADGSGNWSYDASLSAGEATPHAVSAEVTDAAGNAAASPETFITVDTTAPGIPTISGTTPVTGGVMVEWQDPTNADHDYTHLSWLPADGAGEAMVSAGGGSHTATGLSSSFSYDFTVRAYDLAGNPSGSDSVAGIIPLTEMYAVFADLAGTNQDEVGRDIALTAAGDIVISGSAGNGTDLDAFVVKITDGTFELDTAFGSGDGVYTLNNDNDDNARALAVDSSGRIIVTGNTGLDSDTRPGRDLLVFALQSDGTLDTSFASSGIFRLDDVGNFDTADDYTRDYGYDMLIAGDDSIYVTGLTQGWSTDAYVAKFTSAGALDTSYGAQSGFSVGANRAGVYQEVDRNIGGTSGAIDQGRAIALVSGEIVLAGFTEYPTVPDYDMTLQRINGEGTLDTSFNYSSGYNPAYDNMSGGTDTRDYVQPGALAIDGSGNFYLGGIGYTDGSTWDGVVVKTDAAGAVDTAFGSSGSYTFGSDGQHEQCNDVVWDESRGRLYVIGSSTNGSGNTDLVVYALDSQGSLDTNFAGTGIYVHDGAAGGTGDDSGLQGVVTPGGVLLVVGYSANASGDRDVVLWAIEP